MQTANKSAAAIPHGNSTVFFDMNSGRVVNVQRALNENGANIILWHWNRGSNNELWNIIDAGDGYVQIRTRINNGRGLDLHGGGTADGTNIRIWDVRTHDQQWRLIPVN